MTTGLKGNDRVGSFSNFTQFPIALSITESSSGGKENSYVPKGKFNSAGGTCSITPSTRVGLTQEDLEDDEDPEEDEEDPDDEDDGDDEDPDDEDPDEDEWGTKLPCVDIFLSRNKKKSHKKKTLRA